MRAAVALAVLVLAAPARADTPPWSEGVTEAQKTSAKALLDAGNALFLEKRYADALVKYRAAVEAWDHPAIRFNIVRCLIQLDRSVEAAENLERALKYGPAPLEEAVYAEALAYGKLLAKQIGDVTLSCTQPGVAISIDGANVATCPATVTRRIAPGKHVAIATKPGFVPESRELFVVGGEAQRVELGVTAVGTSGTGARFYGKAALITGGGLLVAAGGLALWGYRKYHAQFPEHCGGGRPEVDGRPGCDDVGLAALDRARTFGTVATVVSVLGAATAITGAIVIWRSPRSERRTVVTPSAGGGAIGLAISGQL